MDKSIRNVIKNLSKKDKKTLSQKALKVCEESGELAKAILPYDSAHCTSHKFIDKSKILEEVVDTYLSAISIAYSMDFTDNEINTMILNKVKKWSDIQSNEIDNPLPFEIHVTIKGVNDSKFIEEFRENCKVIEVKPIIIDLECSDDSIIKDVMTSSKHFGDNRSAYEESERIITRLNSFGYEVLRNKIESAPWHPAAPKEKTGEVIPNGCYFESHIGVEILPEEKSKLSSFIKKMSSDKILNGSVKLSQNFFKKSVDGSKFINMLTYRDNKTCRRDFESEVNLIKEELNIEGFMFEKVEVEYAVYDTNVNHDSKWILGK